MSLQRRLERLEDKIVPGAVQDWNEWPIEDQFVDVENIYWFHGCGISAYLGTDREIHLMGQLAALWGLPDGVGEYRFSSGTVVEWSRSEDGMQAVTTTGALRVEDLPEGIRERWERLDPERQTKRERQLFERRRLPGEPTIREQVRMREEEAREYSKRSKQRDRDLLERNRAACGIAPLTPEQISKWDLEGTHWEGEEGS